MSERPRAVLIHPNSRGNYVQSRIPRENLGIAYLSSYLKVHGFEPEVYDSRIKGQTPEQLAQEILKGTPPTIIGVSLITIEGAGWTEELSRIIKEEAQGKLPHIVVGNFFPTLQPQRALREMPSIDSVVCGEGEETLLELASCVAANENTNKVRGIIYRAEDGAVCANDRRSNLKNLDNLPFPDHYAADYGLTEFAIEGSRGCYCKCSFCAIDPFICAECPSDRWRARTPTSIVEEIVQTKREHPNISLYRFIDPDFIGAPKHVNRLREFVRALGNSGVNINFIIDARTNEVIGIPKQVWRDLRDVGLVEVYLGIETSSSDIKRMMRKGSTPENDQRAIELLNSLGIRVRFGWMMITPWTTTGDIEANAQTLHDLGFPRLDKYFQELNLIPGTEAMEMVKREGVVWPDGKSDYYTYDVPPEIDNLRKAGRILVRRHLDFLNRFILLHEQIEALNRDNDNLAQDIMRGLNDLNLSVFLAVYQRGMALGDGVSEKEIEKLTTAVVERYEPEITALENQLRGIGGRLA